MFCFVPFFVNKKSWLVKFDFSQAVLLLEAVLLLGFWHFSQAVLLLEAVRLLGSRE